MRKIYTLHDEYAAWYSGEQDRLMKVYGGGTLALPAVRTYPSQYRGGAVGAIARFWWGRPITPTQGTTKIHVPAAADISALSADLLYSEPQSYALPESAPARASGRLDSIIDRSELGARLLESAEMSSFAGGCYLVAFVDQTIADVPLVAVYGHDVAVPEWRHGRLVAVTFWRQLTDSGERDGEVYRHLERHEVIGGAGFVFHGLYRGGADKLGMRVDLSKRPETAAFVGMVEPESGAVATGSTRLDVAYVPNVRPHRTIAGCPLGRSDYSSILPQFDALDETWSSWMRDLRLAKARIVVPASYIQSGGPGKGGYFDAEQEVFTSVNMMGRDDQGMQLSQVQFAIRVDEHERTAAALWRAITRGSGLSQDAFGEEADGPAATAKEIGARGSRTRDTRARKIMYAKPAIAHIVSVLCELDAVHFGGDGMPRGSMPINVEWPAELPDLESVARTVQLFDAASAVSLRTKIGMAHPRWGTSEIDAEIAEIDGDRSRSAPPPLPDPFARLD